MAPILSLDRFNIGNRHPSTIEACAWAPGGQAMCYDGKNKLSDQQTVKLKGTVEEQTAKTKQGVKRDCTEDTSCDY